MRAKRYLPLLPARAWATLGLVLAGVAIAIGYVALSAASKDPVAWANLNTLDAHSLAFVGGDPGHLLFGHHQGIFESRDGGQTARSEH